MAISIGDVHRTETLLNENGIWTQCATGCNESHCKYYAGKKWAYSTAYFCLNWRHIYVNEDITSASCVRQHLSDMGLTCKDLGLLENYTRVLGLKVWWEHDVIYWKRRNEIPKVLETLTRRIIFSLCDGKLIGHYPIFLIGNFRIAECGWQSCIIKLFNLKLAACELPYSKYTYPNTKD